MRRVDQRGRLVVWHRRKRPCDQSTRGTRRFCKCEHCQGDSTRKLHDRQNQDEHSTFVARCVDGEKTPHHFAPPSFCDNEHRSLLKNDGGDKRINAVRVLQKHSIKKKLRNLAVQLPVQDRFRNPESVGRPFALSPLANSFSKLVTPSQIAVWVSQSVKSLKFGEWSVDLICGQLILRPRP